MMRCFLPCFGSSKRQKHLRLAIANPTGEGQTHVAEGAVEAAIQSPRPKTAVEESIDWIAESKIENVEQSHSNRAEAKSSEEVIKNDIEGTEEERGKAARVEKTTPQQTGEKNDNHEEVEEESSESLFSLSLGSGKPVSAAQNADTEVNSPMQLTRKEVSGSTPNAPEKLQHQVENLPQEEQQSEKEAKMENTKVLEGQPNVNEESSAKELIKKLDENNEEKGKARPLNHPLREYRYRDFSDEGYEDINLDYADLDDDQEEYSSESLFSLSTDYRKRISSTEKEENEVISSVMPAHITQEESQGNNILEVSSVLNPIENLTQGKVLKPTVLQQPLKNDKENINLVGMQDVDIPIRSEPSLRISKSNRKVRQKMKEEKEIGVDTSLSSWLVESETTPKSIKSTNSVGEQHTPKGGRGSSPAFSNEDRPILGALTLEEIRKYSMSAASSRRSRSRSPDEKPIIGTVGSYWSHTGQSSMSSKFNNSTGKDVKLNWSSSKVKTRLEPAFEASVTET